MAVSRIERLAKMAEFAIFISGQTEATRNGAYMAAESFLTKHDYETFVTLAKNQVENAKAA